MSEDVQFLKELQHELNTQDNDCQAAPRFWAIKDYRMVPGNEDYDSCTTSYFHNDGDHTEFDTVEDLKEYLTDYYLDDVYEYLCLDVIENLKELLDAEDTPFSNLWEFIIDYLNDDGYFDECPMKEEEFIRYNTMFLTKAEAKKHLELNHYHYSEKAHTYAMTAWRAPKVERLMKIIETFQWDKVKLAEEVTT